MVQGLWKSFDRQFVLRDIELSIEEGDLVSIIGPSGCGKSTLLRCLNGLEVMDSGSVDIAGINVSRTNSKISLDAMYYHKMHELRKKVGMVFQGFELFPHMTLLQNVMIAPIVVLYMSRDKAEKNALYYLSKVGLSNYKNRYPTRLSGGQRQRAAIARALAMSPQVMLYDEPTSSLDPELVDEVLQVMHALDADGMTQVIVTHEMEFARDASDYIIFMEKGKIIEISDEDEIFIQPKDPRTKKFLARYI